MPFTLSHPAAAIPFTRKGLILSALIIGSMMPDAPYFFFKQQYRAVSHSVTGAFFFCLPAGMIALWIFHRVLKLPSLALLPENHQKRLQGETIEFHFWPLNRLVNIIFSLCVGTLTHITWDSFTHSDGFFVKQFVLLQAHLVTVWNYDILIFKVLQHGSSLIGASMLSLWYWQWYKNAEEKPIPKRLRYTTRQKMTIIMLIMGISLLIGLHAGFDSALTSTKLSIYRSFIGGSIVTSMTVSVVAIFLFSIQWHIVRGRNHNPDTATTQTHK